MRSISAILLLFFIFTAAYNHLNATELSGRVLTVSGDPIPFASIFVKDGTRGTTSNAEGYYRIDLPKGSFRIICAHVGYERKEASVNISDNALRLDFILNPQTLSMKEIVIRPGGEDPAYEIIRNAIKNRTYHRDQISAWSCEAYIKGLLQLSKYPRSVMGQKILFEDQDTAQQRILYLSETIANVHVSLPDKQKIEVVSTRVSGQSNAFGLGSPQPISFYNDRVNLSSAINPRGFVSPIADNALFFYRYKFKGSFVEDGQLINRIEVIPKRAYEPLFKGYIQIVENDWNIHSLNLLLTRASDMQLLDTLSIEQSYHPVKPHVRMLQNQALYPRFRQLGFEGGGYFITVFSDYNLQDSLPKKFFDRTLLKYDSASNKRSLTYWEQKRPLPLSPEELRDFTRKDSLERRRQDPTYLDSLDKRQNRLQPAAWLITGQTFSRRRDSLSYTFDPLSKTIHFNTVEGFVLRLSGTLVKDLPGRKRISISPVFRHGFGNKRTNAYATARYRFGNAFAKELQVSAGSRVFQFNNNSPVSQIANSFNTLFFTRNFLKIYEAKYLHLQYGAGLGHGLNYQASIRYQSRQMLENTDISTYWGRNPSKRIITPNLPAQASSATMPDHQAFITNFTLTWRPRTRYVEYPDRTISISSGAPQFSLAYTLAPANLLGSDADFSKWKLSVRDDIPLGLAGKFSYRVNLGGFLQSRRIEFPDYHHFYGSPLLKAGEYLNTFQLSEYYALSNRSRLFAQMHAEHNFSGALTNKIPLIRKLNLDLILGTNALFTNDNGRYWEAFVSIDNILKIFRIDMLMGKNISGQNISGIRLGIRGVDRLLEED